jgi:hypothetical protein
MGVSEIGGLRGRSVSVPGDGGDSAGAAGTGGGVAGRRPSDRSAMVEMWNFTQAERGPNGRGEIGADRAFGEGR